MSKCGAQNHIAWLDGSAWQELDDRVRASQQQTIEKIHLKTQRLAVLVKIIEDVRGHLDALKLIDQEFVLCHTLTHGMRVVDAHWLVLNKYGVVVLLVPYTDRETGVTELVRSALTTDAQIERPFFRHFSWSIDQLQLQYFREMSRLNSEVPVDWINWYDTGMLGQRALVKEG